jgi:hypothetical protein
MDIQLPMHQVSPGRPRSRGFFCALPARSILLVALKIKIFSMLQLCSIENIFIFNATGFSKDLNQRSTSMHPARIVE